MDESSELPVDLGDKPGEDVLGGEIGDDMTCKGREVSPPLSDQIA